MPPTLEVISASSGSAPAPGAILSSNSALARDRSAAMRLVAFIGLILCTLAIWCLVHPYGGIIQDAVFYALAASARLHPQSLPHDIFLGRGSQDNYTIFSPLVAALIRWVGIGWASALVTAAGQAALYGAAALLARRLLPMGFTIFAVALLVMLPSFYGSHHIFAYTEDFMTSRVPAEAFVFASLAAALDRRHVLAGVCIAIGMLLHPLTALPGVVMLYLIVVQPRPWPAAAAALAMLGAMGLAAWWMPFWRIARIDSAWLDLLHWRMRYGFPTLWSLGDWGRACVPLATLAAGAIGNVSPSARRFCRFALATGVAGVVFSVLGADLLHILVVAQVQPWRWLWVSGAAAVLLLPIIAADCWRGGDAGRACLILIVASWLSYEQTFGAVVAALAVAAAAMRNASIDPARARRLLIGSLIILAIVALVGAGWLIHIVSHEEALPASSDLRRFTFGLLSYRLRAFTVDGMLPALLFSAIWWVATQRQNRFTAPAVLLVGVAMLCVAAPFARSAWSDPAPSEAFRAKFAAWRQQIPPAAQVLGPGVPIIPWFLLDRASYWSIRQMAGVPFSRTTAMELVRRMAVVTNFPAARNGAEALKGMCASDPLIDFIVSRGNLGPSPFAPVSFNAADGPNSLYLYRCADVRARPGANTARAPHTQE